MYSRMLLDESRLTCSDIFSILWSGREDAMAIVVLAKLTIVDHVSSSTSIARMCSTNDVKVSLHEQMTEFNLGLAETCFWARTPRNHGGTAVARLVFRCCDSSSSSSSDQNLRVG